MFILRLYLFRLQTLEDKEVSSEEETLLEKQVEKSTIELSTLTHEGKELVGKINHMQYKIQKY